MKNTQKIQISIYKTFESPMGYDDVCETFYQEHNEFEFIYETEISSVADFLAVTYQFDKLVQYKKPTDKNWYTARSMMKRLFKKEVANNKPIIKIVETIPWEQKREEKRLKAIAAAKRKAAKEDFNELDCYYYFNQDTRQQQALREISMADLIF